MATKERFSSLVSKSSDITVFCRIAKENGTTLSLRDVILLASLDMTEDELEQEWKECDNLNSTFEIVSGRILERSSWLDHERPKVPADHHERIARATTNIAFAKKFAAWLRDDKLKLVSISGSTSYLSVSREDDLDFFVVTKKNCMWLSFVKALMLARLFRLIVPKQKELD